LVGRKPVYQLGMASFLMGSALSGAAPTMDVLIVARAIQGIGGGALGTVPLTIVGDLYTPTEGGRMPGLFAAVWGVSGALGPTGAATAVALLVAFVLVERRTPAPIVPLTLLTHRLIGTALLASLLAGAVMFGLTNFIPLFVQGVEGHSARAAGVVMTPLSVA